MYLVLDETGFDDDDTDFHCDDPASSLFSSQPHSVLISDDMNSAGFSVAITNSVARSNFS